MILKNYYLFCLEFIICLNIQNIIKKNREKLLIKNESSPWNKHNLLFDNPDTSSQDYQIQYNFKYFLLTYFAYG